VALAYPIWYEPEALAEQRLHAATQSQAVQKTRRKWREIALLLRRMEGRLAPSDAAWARPWTRQAYARIAWSAFREAMRGRRFAAALHEALGGLSMLRLQDMAALMGGRHPPVLDIARAQNRPTRPDEPQIVLVTEFYPGALERSVFGAFIRLRMLIEAAMQAGFVNLVFFWPKTLPPAPAEARALLAALEEAWGFAGAIWLCPAGLASEQRSPSERVTDWFWQWRGAMGFFEARPSQRSCGAKQGALLRMIIHASKADLAIGHTVGSQAGLRRADLAHPPVHGDFPNIEHVRMVRRGDVAPGLAGRLGATATALMARHAETRLARYISGATVCSAVDRAALARLVPGLPISVVPNAMPEAQPVPLSESPIALFVGTFLYPPNREALDLLRQDIWPIVRQRIPDARLLLVGEGGERLRWRNDAANGIELLGFVADLAPLYAQARLFVAPIRQGSGTRFKIVEAAAYGRACVATAIGAEGLLFRNGDSILLRDSIPDFAEACIRLLQDRDLAESIGAAALALARRAYDRHSSITLFHRAIDETRTEKPRANALASVGRSKPPRRILFIGGTSEPGGLHIHTMDVGEALARSGAEVAILNTSIDYFSQLTEDPAITVHTAPLPEEGTRFASFRAWQKLLAPWRGWDMVICRGTSGDTPLAALLAMRGSARRLFTIEHRPVRPQGPAGSWRRLRCRLMGKVIHRAVAVSEETRQSAIAGGYLAPAQVLTCLNWVDTAAFRADERMCREARRHFGFADDVRVLGYSGRLAPDKRVDVLLQAFAGLEPAQKFHLMLIGDGWKKEELRRQAEELGFAERVMFLGWQPNPGYALAALDLFILPSLVEGFALSLLEAMAAGRVCLAHGMDSAREAIVDGESGLIGDFTTADGLTATIQRALSLSAAERRAMGQAASERIVARFARHLRLPAVLRALEADEAALVATTWRPTSERHFAFVG
jgi:glycosyltransferase involved in cell wall biosynthesis